MMLRQRFLDLSTKLEAFLANQALPPARKLIGPILFVISLAFVTLTSKNPGEPLSAADMRDISGCYARGPDTVLVSKHLFRVTVGSTTLSEANPKTENQRYPVLRTRIYLDYDNASGTVTAKRSGDEMYVFVKSDWDGRYIEALDKREGETKFRQTRCAASSVQ